MLSKHHRHKLIFAFLFFLGGAAMYLAVEDIAKGFWLVTGSILLDLAVDEAVLVWERRYGELQ